MKRSKRRQRWRRCSSERRILFARSDPNDRTGYGVCGRHWNAQICRREEHDGATRRSATALHRRQSGNFGSDGPYDPPASDQSAKANRALKDAQEIGQAATLMFALTYAAKAQTHCGHFAHANSLLEQVIALADQKSSPYWKGFGMSEQACALVATGDTSAAVYQFKLGMTTLCSTGATLFVPWFLSNLARAYGDLGELDDAWRTSTKR